MKKYRNFKCSDCSFDSQLLVKDEVKVIDCPECKGEMKRMLSAPRCFQNTVGKSPSAR